MGVLFDSLEFITRAWSSGTRSIQVTCNPMRRKLYIVADQNRLVLDCPNQRETRIYRDILREHVERLESRRV